eukprot:SAG11_NODE_1236_length_5426_cov_10.879857_1_plen_232_part_00
MIRTIMLAATVSTVSAELSDYIQGGLECGGTPDTNTTAFDEMMDALIAADGPGWVDMFTQSQNLIYFGAEPTVGSPVVMMPTPGSEFCEDTTGYAATLVELYKYCSMDLKYDGRRVGLCMNADQGPYGSKDSVSGEGNMHCSMLTTDRVLMTEIFGAEACGKVCEETYCDEANNSIFASPPILALIIAGAARQPLPTQPACVSKSRTCVKQIGRANTRCSPLKRARSQAGA